MCGDLISREALKKKLQARYDNGEEDFDKGYNIGIKTAMDLIDSAPTVEVDKLILIVAKRHGKREMMLNALRPHGEWIYNQYDGNANIGNWHCSECRHIIIGGYNQKPTHNFCPNCGADMRGSNTNE